MFGADFLNLLPMRVWGTMSNYILMAVPVVHDIWELCSRSRAWQKNFWKTMALLFGRVRGGLAISVLIVGADACSGNGE